MSRVAQQSLFAIGAAAAASLTFEAITTNPTDGQTITFTGVNIGAAASDRRVFIVIPYYNGTTSNVSIASVTIGGILATIHTQAFQQGPIRGGCAIVSAAVSTGTTANVVITWSSGSAGYYRPRIAVYRVTGLQSAVAHATITETGGSYAYPRAKSIGVLKDGIVLVGCCMYGNGTSLTLSNVTRDFVVSPVSSVAFVGGSLETIATTTLSVSIGGLTSGDPGLVMASFR